ncbi:hypothetical protein ACFVMC_12245 [Nocardia sp. NPDC127579]|uniref:hypothetical protein n=1 Tax=Nocardia sp. NPDC127579 TaxID=3345402 RepID=UPI00363D6EDB
MTLHTTRKSSARRILARVAVAGALTAIPLTALAVPATATPDVPGVTDVRHGHDRCDRNPWDDGFWDNDPWDDWHDRDRCDRRRKPHDPFDGFWHHPRPHGLFFGSS